MCIFFFKLEYFKFIEYDFKFEANKSLRVREVFLFFNKVLISIINHS